MQNPETGSTTYFDNYLRLVLAASHDLLLKVGSPISRHKIVPFAQNNLAFVSRRSYGANLQKGFLTVLAVFVVFGQTAIWSTKVAHATQDTSPAAFINGQNYNQLITDADFTATGSMSVGDIQSFLSSQGSGLATISTSQLGSGANGRGAAQIIYDAAHAADSASSGCAQGVCLDTSTGTVSPKVILITLQKEQSLVTSASPSQGTLDTAMGYGCPDAGGCNPTYAGFANQVGWAAWQLRWNYEQSKNGSSSVAPYIVNGTLPNMTYNIPAQNLSGSLTVFLSNNATASLYRYTPHLFNGNYNFWKLGINWFGFGTNPTSGGGVDDTSALQAGTYDASFIVSGTKASDDTVSFNGAQIAGTGSTSWKVTISPAMGTNTYVVNYSSGGSKAITIQRRIVGDINGDGKVNILDMSIMFSNWGDTVQGDNFADLNNVNNWMSLNPDVDNKIDILDLSLMFNHWTG